MAAVSAQLRAALGYDSVNLTPSEPAARPDDAGCLVVCPIRDAEGPLGYLVADNRASGRPVDPCERELLEMLSEYLAIALRNSHLYGEIADTKRSLEQLIASAGDAIISVDAGDRIDGWNPAAERVFGRAAAEVTGRRITELLPEREYRTARERLAGGIAHDFNNLLQAILGYAQLMKANPTDPALLQRSLSVVESAALDGSETVRRIQQFARLRPDERFMPVDVNQIVQDAVAITRPRWEEKIAHDRRPMDLRLDLRAKQHIHGRSAALTEVMTNLVLNAMDAMPDGGTLSIATKDAADAVVVVVTDTGIGMPEHVRRRVFEPFFSTKGESGSGLGLSMAYSIIRRHGGDIRVESEPSRGTTFTLVVPCASEAPEPPSTPSTTAPRRSGRVLLVDDEPQVLSALAELLQAAGHEVSAAASGAAALKIYSPGRYDVVLTNIGMAGMNGWEVAERVRAVDAKVPVVFITGWGLREEERARLSALRVQRCLFKPVRPDELDAAVQAAVASV